MSWRLLITRPEAEAHTQAAALAQAGFPSLCLPLQRIQPLDESPEQRQMIQDLDRYAAVLVTSRIAAQCAIRLMDRHWPQPPHSQPWFAVGRATAAILHEYGLPAQSPTHEDSEGLLAMPTLRTALQAPHSRALIIKGEKGRNTLSSGLSAWGAKVQTLELYRRVNLNYPGGHLHTLIQDNAINALVVNNGESLAHLHNLLQCEKFQGYPWTIFVPGHRVAALARATGFTRIFVCEGAHTEDLLKALQQVTPES